jgi:hypothetical protein
MAKGVDIPRIVKSTGSEGEMRRVEAEKAGAVQGTFAGYTCRSSFQRPSFVPHRPSRADSVQ